VSDPVNGSFELPDADETPGEALGWVWRSLQQALAWAEFNITTALSRRSGLEGFEGGFRVAPMWTFADEPARLAAGPYAAEQVGLFAEQIDTKTLWRLATESPATWVLFEGLGNEDSRFELGAASVAQFNDAAAAYEDGIEQFSIWGDGATWSGPPWEEVVLVRADAAPAPGLPWAGVGFRGWRDTLSLAPENPLACETFDEAWGNDPFAVAGRCASGQAPFGVLRGAPLSFPLTIADPRSRIVVWRHGDNRLHVLDIPIGAYANASDLADALQVVWLASLGGASAASWGAWTEGSDSGLAFGRTTLLGGELCVLGCVEGAESQDARGVLGLAGCGPIGAQGSVRMPVSLTADVPTALLASDAALLDPWATVDWAMEYDLAAAAWLPLDYGQAAVSFASPTFLAGRVERFEIEDWTWGTWKSGYISSDLTPAPFVGGLGAGARLESFENPGTTWPDWIWS
jgi:hypothetical protein